MKILSRREIVIYILERLFWLKVLGRGEGRGVEGRGGDGRGGKNRGLFSGW